MTLSKSPWRRVAATVLAMLLVLLIAASYRFAASRGVFASVEDKSPAACHTVAGISEVTAMVPVYGGETNGAFVATKDGGLFLWTSGTTTRVSGMSKGSRAMAMSLDWENGRVGVLQALMARAKNSYYVASLHVTPLPDKHSIAVQEIGRLTTDQLTDPADLVALDGGRFYLVNCHTSHTGLGRWLDDSLLLPRAEILYFDGMKFVKVAERLNSPAGLALSADGSRLFVAQGLPRNIIAFSRNDFVGSLDDAVLTDLPAAAGKMMLAADGSLIVAATPKRGTGAVYRVPVANGVLQTPELLYSTTTEEVTAAAEAGGHLLIGTPTKLIDCPK